MLNKQGDNIQPWRTPFPTWNHSIVLCLVPLLLFDQHTDFSGGRPGGCVFLSFQEFSQFVVIHTVKAFSIVNEAEVDVFLELSTFSMIQSMLAIWSLVPLPFLNPAWTSRSSQFKYCWSLAWRILSITLLPCQNEWNCAVVWIFFGIAFLWDWNENWPFPVLWPLLSFPNSLVYWLQHFNSIILRIWNSSAGIPSPPVSFSHNVS